MELRELVALLANWADTQPIIRRVVLFGSRARQDNGPESDVDLRIEFDDAGPRQAELAHWGAEVQTDFAELKAKLPGPLSFHNDAQDAALQSIRDALRQPVLASRKVVVVFTPAWPK